MFFSKYSASGNDFIITHAFAKKDRSALARELCDRHEGIGADGLVVLLPHETYDFQWEFYNADGSCADMCGNASRAVGHYAHTQGLAESRMRFLSGAGEIGVSVEGDVAETQLTPPKILDETIVDQSKEWWLINTGVPHLVCFVEDLDLFDIAACKEMRERYNANVNFGLIADGDILVRTYERGVEGETLACGTGMAAVFLRALQENQVSNPAKVRPASGETLELRSDGTTLFFKGRVKKVFDTIRALH